MDSSEFYQIKQEVLSRPICYRELEAKEIIALGENHYTVGNATFEVEPLVAHNKPFDEGCLRAVFRTYRMDYPHYRFYDTLRASRRKMPHLRNHQLHTVAAECGFQLKNHHHALADAEACAWIAREIL